MAARITDLLKRLPAALAAAVREVPEAPPELLEPVNARAAAFKATLPAI